MRSLLDPKSYDAVPGFRKRARADQARMIAELTLAGDVTVCVLVFRGRSLTNSAAEHASASGEHLGQGGTDFGAAR